MTIAMLVDPGSGLHFRRGRPGLRAGACLFDCPEGTAIVSRRKAAAQRLAETGRTAHEIAAITGHASPARDRRMHQVWIKLDWPRRP